MAETVLVIDDDAAITELVRLVLGPAGYSVYGACSGVDGLALFHQLTPDLVLLDVMMPGLDGLEVCSRLRQISSVPILILTARNAQDDVVRGLSAGADDFLGKPFRVKELKARVSAQLRRARMVHTPPETLRFGSGELIFDRLERKVFVRGREVALSPIEHNLLLYLAERAGRILPAELLFNAIWGPQAEAGPRSVKWYIWRLRRKIEADPKNPHFIITEPGKGYRFSPL